MGQLHEECGVFGIYCPKAGPVALDTYYGLYSLQHRGQESCGIVVNDDGIFRQHKDVGLVSTVFPPDVLRGLGEGNMAIGHTRYGTTGGNEVINAQPIVVNHVKGHMAIAHNGNLVNASDLRRELELQGSIFHMTSDTEVISYIIIKERLTAPSIEEAVNRAMHRLKGAYSLVIMSPSKLIAARDEHGFRPLCYGRREDGSYVIASETCALAAAGAQLVRDLDPGEILIIDNGTLRSIRDHCGKAPKTTCIFEYIYFARPDSVIDGCGVHLARIRAGECLAEDYPVDADIVVGVPDSGLDAAIGYARMSGIPYEIGFIKNKYIARTFIAPDQKMREHNVHIKLNPIADVVRGKRIVLVDDSIVRGTTCARILHALREAGAKEVHMRVSAPPFRNPCYYGTDIDSQDMLIACQHSIEEICDIIGADSLGYLKPERLCELIGSVPGVGYCDACFTARYPTETPKDSGKSRFETKLSEKEKK
ncbi:MAG: amidophosphoribosyltransferase [Oscillospiraceae bacterium]|nr:amidophosphoribosyltransferase [Oscillospiraceae bacterium]